MASAVTVNFDASEFNRTLEKYRTFSKRDLPTIVNTKAMFIARRAIIETPKVNKATIAKELGEFVTTWSSNKPRKRRALVLATSQRKDAPLAALIVQARQREKSLPGLYGRAMEKAIRAFIASRVRSIAFLASGWIPAVKALLPYAETRGAPKIQRNVKQYGQEKGSAQHANDGFRPTATIVNSASQNKNNKDALVRYGGPALQRAFDAETQSMLQYMERKMRETARDAGVKTN